MLHNCLPTKNVVIEKITTSNPPGLLIFLRSIVAAGANVILKTPKGALQCDDETSLDDLAPLF